MASRRPSQKVKVLKPLMSEGSVRQVSGRRPSQKVKVLKQPSVTVWDCDYVMSVKSQTFPEGKGVETFDKMSSKNSRTSCRRPSQKVKVLKLLGTGGPELSVSGSQTFPEGKGVETQRCTQLQAELCGRRPSQKVKVLKLVTVRLDGMILFQSQTFPEGKGVETPR